VTTLPPLQLDSYLAREGVVLVALALSDSGGRHISENVYWPGRDETALQALNTLPPQPVRMRAHATTAGDEISVLVELEDSGSAPVLAAKLTLVDDAGRRILPAFYSDNYLALLPGERCEVEIRYARAHAGAARVTLRGWNVEPGSISIEGIR
jgi:hypothetical protein